MLFEKPLSIHSVLPFAHLRQQTVELRLAVAVLALPNISDVLIFCPIQEIGQLYSFHAKSIRQMAYLATFKTQQSKVDLAGRRVGCKCNHYLMAVDSGTLTEPSYLRPRHKPPVPLVPEQNPLWPNLQNYVGYPYEAVSQEGEKEPAKKRQNRML